MTGRALSDEFIGWRNRTVTYWRTAMVVPDHLRLGDRVLLSDSHPDHDRGLIAGYVLEQRGHGELYVIELDRPHFLMLEGNVLLTIRLVVVHKTNLTREEKSAT
jgi:hypothetical protein